MRHTTRMLLAFAILALLVTQVQAVKRFQQPSKNYTAGTRIYDIPPSSNRKYLGVRATLTRESWPGETTVAVAMSIADTGLVVPLGAGDTNFPAAPFMISVKRLDGEFEVMDVTNRVGDVLTVVRRRNAGLIEIGSGVTLLTLVRVRFEASLDGTTWTGLGEAGFPGGSVLDPDTGLPATVSGVGFSWTNSSGGSIARDGDTRVVITNYLPIRTALTLEMVETVD